MRLRRLAKSAFTRRLFSWLSATFGRWSHAHSGKSGPICPSCNQPDAKRLVATALAVGSLPSFDRFDLEIALFELVLLEFQLFDLQIFVLNVQVLEFQVLNL